MLLLALALFAAVASGLRIDLRTRRGAVLGACTAAVTLQPLRPAFAEGSKSDKKFQECLSKCVYQQTKITKGIAQVEVIGRSEAYAICKPKCATSKEQARLPDACTQRLHLAP